VLSSGILLMLLEIAFGEDGLPPETAQSRPKQTPVREILTRLDSMEKVIEDAFTEDREVTKHPIDDKCNAKRSNRSSDCTPQ